MMGYKLKSRAPSFSDLGFYQLLGAICPRVGTGAVWMWCGALALSWFIERMTHVQMQMLAPSWSLSHSAPDSL